MIKKKIVNINIQDFNEKLKTVKKLYNVHFDSEPKGELKWNAYIIDKISKIELTFKDIDLGGKAVTYICDKTAFSNIIHERLGMEAYSTLQKYYKTPHVASKEEAKFSVSGILYYNEKYVGTRQHAYGYDLNSAFSYGMLQKMPAKTEDGPINYKKGFLDYREVKKDEIGFDVDGELVLPGGYAMYIFKSEESPYKKFVETWYNKKKNAKNQEEKQIAKDTLNMCIGFMQRHNFWIRAAIIGYCNKTINDLINKYPDNILLSNTDSIVSTCRIPEIESNLGTEIGQWKFEHDDDFAYINLNYQWGKTIPTFRGVPKGWFKNGFDILKDKLPDYGNIYKLDKEKLKLVKCEVK